MNKTLIVRHDNETSFSLEGSESQISAFIKWVDNYHHGTFDGLNTINCNAHKDIRACMQKAKRECLIPCVSKNEIKKKFTSM